MKITKRRIWRTTVDVCTCTWRLHCRRKREREPSRIPYKRVKLFRKTKVFQNAAKSYPKESILSSSSYEIEKKRFKCLKDKIVIRLHLLILTLFTATHTGVLTGPEILVSAFQTCPINNSWKSKESNPLCVEEMMLVPICWSCDEWARKNTFPGNIENLPSTKTLWTVPPKPTHGPRSLIMPRLRNKRTNRTKIVERLKPWPTAAAICSVVSIWQTIFHR